jgi:hypothetical protein
MAITRLNSLAIPAGTIVESDLSYPLTNFSSTGIDDNATSTAVTIDSAGKVGIGTASPNRNLTVSSTFPVVQLLDSDNGLGQTGNDGLLIYQSGANANISNEYAGTLQFGTSGGVRATIDSSGRVGIGTTSPGEKLDVDGTIQVISSGNQGLAAQIYTDSAGNMNLLADHGNNGGGDHIFRNGSAGTELVRILNTGNVGIGTSSPDTALDINGNTSATPLTVRGGNASLASIDLIGGTSGTDNSSIRSKYNLHIDCNSTGAISNRSIVFGNGTTETMRIDSSGFVGIGTSSPDRYLHVNASRSGDWLAEIHNTHTTNGYGLKVRAGDDANVSAMRVVDVNNTTIMEIQGGGNVGIGIAPVSGYGRKLQVHSAAGGGASVHITDSVTGSTASDGLELITFNSAAYIWNREASFMSFGTSATERMRIDSSGRLLIGKTAVDNSIAGYMFETGSTGYAAFTNTGTASSHRNILCNRQSADGDTIQFQRGNTLVGSISVTSSATAYNTSSDQRLKENIVDAPAGNIDAIRVRSFDWKADGTHQTYGMVAQELVDVAPEAVAQGDTDDDMWSVDYSKLVPMMIKEIQDLKAEVAALKGA